MCSGKLWLVKLLFNIFLFICFNSAHAICVNPFSQSEQLLLVDCGWQSLWDDWLINSSHIEMLKSLIWWQQCQPFLIFLFRLTLDQQLSWQQTDKQIKLSPFKSFSSFFQYVMVSVCWPLLDLEPRMYGEVKSPQYPKPYPPNLQEQWELIVPEGFQIRMTFTHLDIEASAGCHYDALTVRVTFKVNNIT